MPQKSVLKKYAGKESEIRKLVRCNVRARRLQMGLSQTELGDACGVSQAFIAKIENHRDYDTPHLDLLAAIARALKTTVSDLTCDGRFDAGVDVTEDLRLLTADERSMIGSRRR